MLLALLLCIIVTLQHMLATSAINIKTRVGFNFFFHDSFDTVCFLLPKLKALIFLRLCIHFMQSCVLWK